MISNGTQPAFWLEVRKEYVVDNFERLLSYLRYYTYTRGEDEQSDFNKSLQCLGEVVADLVDAMSADCLYKHVGTEWGDSWELNVRMIGAYLLASEKKGVQQRQLLLRLADFLLLSGNVDVPSLSDCYDLVVHCAQGCPVAGYGFSWDDLSTATFRGHLFAAKLAKTRFGEPPASPFTYYEGKGLLKMEEGRFQLVCMNLAQSLKNRLVSQVNVRPDFDIMVAEGDRTRKTEFPDLFLLCNNLFNEQMQVQPSPQETLKTYTTGDTLTVRVTYVRNTIYAESIDPRYEKLKGKVYVMYNLFFIPPETFYSAIRLGDKLRVRVTDRDDFTFSLDEEFDAFYEQEARHYVGEVCDAVLFQVFRGGTRFISQDGLVVNVFHDDSVRIDGSRVSRVRIKGCVRDRSNHVVVNGELADGVGECVEGQDFRRDAQQQLIEDFVDTSEESSIQAPSPKGIAMPVEAVRLLSHLFFSMTATAADSYAAYYRLMASRMLARLTDSTADEAFLSHEINYRNAIVKFAQGNSARTLSLQADDALDASPLSKAEDKIIGILTGYNDSSDTTRTPHNKFDDESAGYLAELVNASNTLNGKADVVEINRIKKAIATFLGVGDIYQSIYRELTWYGDESDTLEFKKSLVYSTAEGMLPDMATHKWAILRTVCGFFNTISGGELLLGVDDHGYSCGLKNDLSYLHANGYINEESMDKYRNYVKLMLDKAFSNDRRTVNGPDITANHVDFRIERNKEGDELLRIQVKPYERGIICFSKDLARPDNIEESYYRSSGSTQPMTKTVKDELTRKKALMNLG